MVVFKQMNEAQEDIKRTQKIKNNPFFLTAK